MLKEHIIATTLELFARNGVRKVSMDDIARRAGVSKRTLYEFFDDKETLLVQILETNFNRAGECLARLTKETYTALEIFLLFNEKLMATPVWYCEAFYQDICRYPEAYACMKRGKQKFLDMATLLLKQGIREGVFCSDIDFDIIALLAREQMEMSQPAGVFCKYSHTDVHNTFFLLFIRGICTDAGRKILERYSVKKQFKA
ncbi:MAG: TetR/AcrR family transcriptional regulator [Tannerella sp.]|jgi:AcrR family transcriptional regulator|nr:TetR/AcrR family transcriptional regulator [Tannerella sp.]